MNANVTQTSKEITIPQIRKIHTQFGQLAWLKKDGVIRDFTNDRTSSCKDLTCAEASDLINYLEDTLKGNYSKRIDVILSIVTIAREWGYIYGHTDIDTQINHYLLDKFCLERGAVKKKLIVQTLTELKRTLRQFKAILKSKTDFKICISAISPNE